MEMLLGVLTLVLGAAVLVLGAIVVVLVRRDRKRLVMQEALLKLVASDAASLHGGDDAWTDCVLDCAVAALAIARSSLPWSEERKRMIGWMFELVRKYNLEPRFVFDMPSRIYAKSVKENALTLRESEFGCDVMTYVISDKVPTKYAGELVSRELVKVS